MFLNLRDGINVGHEYQIRFKTDAEKDRHKVSDLMYNKQENVAQITENRMVENNLRSKPEKTMISNH